MTKTTVYDLELPSDDDSEPVNLTGIHPTEFKVLVLPDESGETFAGSKILKPLETAEKEKWATTKGTVLAVSPLAFSYATAAEWEAAKASKPKAGDRIIYTKYAGNRVTSPRDGKDYLLVNDKDICATIEE